MPERPRPVALLVYANPVVTAEPVPPYGMERVGRALALAGCEVRMISPFVEADPQAAFAAALGAGADLVGFSVRNLDDALVVWSAEGEGAIDTRFVLDPVRPMVQAAVAALGPERVVVGGTAIGAGGLAVARWLGAARAVAGPGEDLLWMVGRSLVETGAPRWPADPRLLGGAPRGPGLGARVGYVPGGTPRVGEWLGMVVNRGGRVPVLVSSGCDRRCHFCVEASFVGRRVKPRPVAEIVGEIEALTKVGVRRFFLVASELNVPDDRHAVELLRALAPLRVDLRCFLQPAPVSDRLLDAMEAAGMHPTDISFEFGHFSEAVLRAGGGPANRGAIDRLVETWLRRGYRQLGGTILLGAHPIESEETVEEALGHARRLDEALPDGLGLTYACGARVYAESPLGRWVREHPGEAAPDLYGAEDPDLVQPVVFCRPGSPRALLARVQDRLRGTRGNMAPMNAEARHDPRRLTAETLVNRAIWRLQEDEPEAAAACLAAALEAVPDHLEALAQLARLRGNVLGDLPGAVEALRRLDAALPEGDERRVEVRRELARAGAQLSENG